MSLESLSTNSYTVQGAKNFIHSLEGKSKVDLAVMGAAMLIIGPVVLTMLVFADAIRGAGHLIESLHDLKNREVVLLEIPAPVDVLPDPKESMIAMAGQIKAKATDITNMSMNIALELRTEREELANKVLEYVKNPDLSSDDAADFVKSVIGELGEAVRPSDLEETLYSEAKRKFLDTEDNLIEFDSYFNEILLESIREMGRDPSLEKVEDFKRLVDVLSYVTKNQRVIVYDEEDVPEITKVVCNAFRGLFTDPNLSSDKRAEKAGHWLVFINILEQVGLPEKSIPVQEIYLAMQDVYGQIAELKRQNEEDIERARNELDREIGDLGQSIDKSKQSIQERRAKIPVTLSIPHSGKDIVGSAKEGLEEIDECKRALAEKEEELLRIQSEEMILQELEESLAKSERAREGLIAIRNDNQALIRYFSDLEKVIQGREQQIEDLLEELDGGFIEDECEHLDFRVGLSRADDEDDFDSRSPSPSSETPLTGDLEDEDSVSPEFPDSNEGSAPLVSDLGETAEKTSGFSYLKPWTWWG